MDGTIQTHNTKFHEIWHLAGKAVFIIMEDRQESMKAKKTFG